MTHFDLYLTHLILFHNFMFLNLWIHFRIYVKLYQCQFFIHSHSYFFISFLLFVWKFSSPLVVLRFNCSHDLFATSTSKIFTKITERKILKSKKKKTMKTKVWLSAHKVDCTNKGKYLNEWRWKNKRNVLRIHNMRLPFFYIVYLNFFC